MTTMSINRRQACLAAAAAALLPASRAANAQQAYPSKPIRMVIPFTPGGSTDVLGRAIGLELGHAWHQPVVVDNLPGAGGSIGADKVAKSPADGYTLLMGHIGTLAINPSLYPKLDYDPVRSFAPVAWVARVPNVLVVHASVPARTLAELVALAKAQPGKLAFGSGGNGSAAHIATEYLKLQTGASFLHVPYRGTAPAVTDLLAGQLQLLFTGAPALLPHIKAGKLRALAVSSPQRIALLPDVPTVAESGVPGTKDFEADQWYGVVAPAGTPADIVALLNRQINQSLNSAEVKARLNAEGAEPTPSTPQVFGQLIASEMKRWDRVIKSAHITVD
ncbi:MAG: ABC transporter substrate-binding protein [Variovorax sp. 67-131]|jgi:tripartite-type tricarboxylate transporter receptor subunit TctC|uniref:Bug family tripartite tricarboxylate transporter substrate binding protein n=2 Tax=Comamonadaceae TaxID=80864 RepID=UPI00086F9F28|nr:tripartite tricarboxylate transporter substrate binding protein [Variovorax sp. SCN 67-85]ODU11388.1 MAG: ABC transporter substrate-binding protein [Variovorax sp. SCN 67-85]ODV27422.1 MAG: ABC transporter substrate-binding protein [Variovorax sp. SCN 67-20]OJZ12055.1 MAG: ABC transporter substrate-binding protein [Variovorax sp. 67-131]